MQGKKDIIVSEFEYEILAKYIGVYMDVFPKNTDISIINTYMSNYYNVNTITAVKDEYAQVEIVLSNEEKVENYYVINKKTQEIITNRIQTAQLPMPQTDLKGRLIFEIPIKLLEESYIKLPEQIKENIIDIKIKTNNDIGEYNVNNILTQSF